MANMPEPTRKKPVTHLTQDQLKRMWYDACDLVGYDLPRRIGHTFPMSRWDLIEKFTQDDLENQRANFTLTAENP